MMRYLLPLLLLSLTACGNGLETREEIDENLGERSVFTVDPETGKRQGEFKLYDANNNLTEIAHYHQGVLTVRRVLFNEKGDTLVVEHYLDFNSEEERRSATAEGLAKVAKASQSLAGEVSGGQLLELLDGPYRSFYEEGSTLKQSGNYVDGSMNGIWKKFYDNGQVAENVTFAGGDENGPFEEFYPDGTLKATGNYKNGDFEHGEIRLFDARGELERVLNCNEGRCETIWRFDDGTPPPAPTTE